MILKNSFLIRNTVLAALVALAGVYSSCNKSDDTETVLPSTITTPVIAGLTSTTAVSGGSIAGYGSSYTLTAEGVCWSATNQLPTINDSKTSDGQNFYFRSALTNLTANTTYYLRAYIQNDAGVGYGNVVKFTTSTTTADTTVTVSTLAGNSAAGQANGTGTNASFSSPQGTAVDAAGNVYVTDAFNHLIRKITPAGVTTTLAGTGTLGFAGGTSATAQFYSPQGIAVDATGNVYVSDQGNNAIYKITGTTVTILAGDGTAGSSNGTGSAARFNSPQGLAVDATGNIYVADRGNNRIRKITPAGVVTTFAGTGATGFIDGDGVTVAIFNRPTGIAADAAGNLYVTDQGNVALRKITTAGLVSTLVGGNKIYNDLLNTPAGVAVDATGNIYMTDQSGRIMIITSQNVLYKLAGKVDTSGFLDGPKTTALFSSPTGIAVDASKNIYVADQNNNRIRKLVVVTR